MTRATQANASPGTPQTSGRKLRLAYALNQVLGKLKVPQAEAARVLSVTQPKVSALRKYKLTGLSVECLMNLLTALERSVPIVILICRR